MVHVKSMNVIKLNRIQTNARSSQKSVRVQIMLERNIYRFVQVYKYSNMQTHKHTIAVFHCPTNQMFSTQTNIRIHMKQTNIKNNNIQSIIIQNSVTRSTSIFTTSIFDTISNFLIPTSLQPNAVGFRYFKFWTLLGLINHKFVANVQFLWRLCG